MTLNRIREITELYVVTFNNGNESEQEITFQQNFEEHLV